MLKRLFKYLLVIILLLVIIIFFAVILRQDIKYDAIYPEITSSNDSAIIARGKYLVYGPAHCADCHSSPDMLQEVNKGKEVALSGGVKFELPICTLYPPNITMDKETGIGKLSDQQIARSLRYGVGFDGRAIFDMMPFHNCSDEDLTAIISYLRTTAPVNNKTEKNSYNLPGKILKAFVLKPVGPTGEILKSIKPDSTIEYGKYLATSIANCRGCHTERDLKTGAFVGKDYAGGFELESLVDKNYLFHTPNISPDSKTGHIYSWSEETFINRFRKGKLIPQSPMPWGPFSRMSDLELKAIYRFLQTVTPVERKIDKIMIVKN